MPTHSKFSTAPSPPPRVSAHSQQVHVCPFTPPPPPGHLTEPPLRGTHSPSFTRTPVSHPISVITRSSGRLVPLRQIQSPISRAAFLVTLTAYLPTPHQTTKAPSGPAPPGFAWVLTPLQPGPSLSRPLLKGLQELPPPRAGCLLSWGGPVVSGGASHTQHSGHTCLPPSSLWMGPG